MHKSITRLVITFVSFFSKVCKFIITKICTAEANRYAIKIALNEIERSSCIRFIEGNGPNNHFLQYTSDTTGCHSLVGYQRLPWQQINLSKGCLRKGTIMHETLHALGFFHQQSASNRDNYIRINENNIKAGTKPNFEKFNADVVTDFNLPYDYESIMHYPSLAFSNNGSPTITGFYAGSEKMGQREKLSAIDIQKINKMYCER